MYSRFQSQCLMPPFFRMNLPFSIKLVLKYLKVCLISTVNLSSSKKVGNQNYLSWSSSFWQELLGSCLGFNNKDMATTVQYKQPFSLPSTSTCPPCNSPSLLLLSPYPAVLSVLFIKSRTLFSYKKKKKPISIVGKVLRLTLHEQKCPCL